jgi:hypothetical protein
MQFHSSPSSRVELTSTRTASESTSYISHQSDVLAQKTDIATRSKMAITRPVSPIFHSS